MRAFSHSGLIVTALCVACGAIVMAIVLAQAIKHETKARHLDPVIFR